MHPSIRVYRSYGNSTVLTVMGQAFRRSALPRNSYRMHRLINLLAVIRLFMVKPFGGAAIRIECNGQWVETQAGEDGFFRVEVPLAEPLAPGWHPIRAQLAVGSTVLAEGEGRVLIPGPVRFACISDIDDTFLVSHSATILKRLYVLLTENAHSRRPFEGVVSHYQLLAEAHSGPEHSNPFFYVSSSEWNLYDYILEFSQKNQLPDGVYLLSQLKTFGQLLQTGKTKHRTKFDRIVRILEHFPQQQFILLGDDSQQDPIIYESVVSHFPKQILAVYIRQVNPNNKTQTQTLLAKIEAAGVACCYFAHSADARQHSVEMGLVAT